MGVDGQTALVTRKTKRDVVARMPCGAVHGDGCTPGR